MKLTLIYFTKLFSAPNHNSYEAHDMICIILRGINPIKTRKIIQKHDFIQISSCMKSA